ncbi:kynureninase [Roseivirga ehrenbergii]|uniref:Kynureninase n=1 Tax=Roseivirga ehrenbergii (strain DSM 102268 / JCM 13514 / KCTC 12282 / NCIMB 14502 / KMM 6017) TaxID=279360 RepID=A0A150XQZ7_ROSEK|nr:kynureninase [Roseivirga ehrenbergii]KYG81065.1 kynureninase [Roseivirga ehrenbergii]TCL00936.1 kynureninase [Roseivirga ehrenbergii]
MTYENTLAYAQYLDKNDPLRDYRDRFHIPKVNGKDSYYFTGNSLGLQPKTARTYIEEEMKGWETLGVEGHFASSKRPWMEYHKFSKDALARIVGAKPIEVVSMNNLSVNLHLLMVSFFKPTKTRYKIICEAGAFPSDQYMFETQLKFHALNPGEALIELKPRTGEHTVRNEDILSKIAEVGDELALVLIGGVQYYTGQLFDMKAITEAGQKVGAKVGFDLAHAFGNVPLQLHDWNVDFATWCSYKYLNSGPGNVSGIFVHERYANDSSLDRFAGWWGHDEKERFKMKKGFQPMPGADGWQLSNVNVISTASHLAALELFDEVGIEKLRKKSLKLTGYLEFLIKDIAGDSGIFEIITPSDPEQRGCQLSIFFHKDGRRLFDALAAAGVIADWREPNVIRIAPVPLYNCFEDVYQFAHLLKKNL